MFNELTKRGLPDVLTFRSGKKAESAEDFATLREELLDSVFANEYGYPPQKPDYVHAELGEANSYFCAGKASLRRINLAVGINGAEFTFPFQFAHPVPVNDGGFPLIIHISFGKDITSASCPAEEILDNGFALASLCYQDICSDGPEGLSDGLSAVLWKDSARPSNGAGELALWAWAASRILDYLLTLDSVDKKNTAVIGHSRLGKAAVVAGAADERFKFVLINDSGCGGAALFRGKQGETAGKIFNAFPHWFCQDFGQYGDNEAAMPFDNHFLLAAIAPRKICIGGAEQDTWCDPPSEYLALYAAMDAYKLLGFDVSGLPERLPVAGDVFQNECVSFHLRKGTHYLSRDDWRVYMEYMKKRMEF
jgi:hypothetical protein